MSRGVGRVTTRPSTLWFVAVASLVAFAALAADEEAGGVASRFDGRVSEWNAAHMPMGVEWAARPFSWLGGIVGITVLVSVVAILLLRAGRRRDAFLLVAATLVAQAATHGPKALFARPRPDAGSAVPLPDSYSFPSGHALTAVVVFGVLSVLVGGGGAYLAATAVALGIGASRVVLNVHFPSDVAAGFLLGFTILVLALAARSPRSWGRQVPSTPEPPPPAAAPPNAR